MRPAIGLIAMLFAARPFRQLSWIGLGLAPFVALTSAVNYARFGTLNPLSYGHSAPGGTSLSGHLIPIAALAAVGLLLVGSRFVKWRPGRREYALAAAVVVLALVLVPAAAAMAQRYAEGAWALLVDARTINDPRSGIERVGDLLSFWDHWKKALGQSMPWLGLLLLAVHAPKDAPLRRLVWIVLIFAAVWSLPFFLRAWHGGLGSNMRYLLPLVPLLCALSARLLIDFARQVEGARNALLAGVIAGALAVLLWTLFHPTHAPGAQQILSTWMLAAVSVLALLAGLRWRGQGAVRVLCLAAVGAGLAASSFYLVMDFRQAQRTRGFIEALATATADLPERAVVYAPATLIGHWALKPQTIAAMPSPRDGAFDHAFIDQALAKGYRVFVWPKLISGSLRAHYGPALRPTGAIYFGRELWEVTPAPRESAVSLRGESLR